MTPAELRRIAEAATKGPWEWDGAEIGQPFTCPEPWETVVSNEVECGAFCLGGVARGIAKGADAEFIATFNPERVLQLLDRVEHLEDESATAHLIIGKYQDRLAAVKNLHPNIHGECHTCSNENGPLLWPCPTIKAVRGEHDV